MYVVIDETLFVNFKEFLASTSVNDHSFSFSPIAQIVVTSPDGLLSLPSSMAQQLSPEAAALMGSDTSSWTSRRSGNPKSVPGTPQSGKRPLSGLLFSDKQHNRSNSTSQTDGESSNASDVDSARSPRTRAKLPLHLDGSLPMPSSAKSHSRSKSGSNLWGLLSGSPKD